MKIHFIIIGVSLIILTFVHAIFPGYFKWKLELAPLSLINRQIMYFHTFFIALTIFLMGILCITSHEELMTTALGKKISLGLGLFWATRLLIQYVGYSPKLWRGKRFETGVHIIFTVIWTYMSGVFLWNYFG